MSPLKFLEPLFQALLWFLKNLWLWMLVLLGFYLSSNICMIQPDEVAVVLRYGQLQGRGSPQALHPPGLLWALPKPIDTVIRIPKTRIFELDIRGLHTTALQNSGKPVSFLARGGLDPEKVGYALTGDGNILHLQFILRYDLQAPIQYVFDFDDPETLMRNVLMGALIDEIGSRSVDDVLSKERSALIADALAQSQLELDQLGLGVRLVSLEMVDLAPPYAVKEDFEAVQSAEIEAQTAIQKAKEYKATQLPLARTQRAEAISEAKEDATKILSTATAETDAFLQLEQEVRTNSTVSHERLYREGLENILSDVGQLRFIPPPSGFRYPSDFRLQVEMNPR
ncbi:MAG: protease modulator HflK [Myxococcota bacterium]|nr:protease modulator HflK [Myxococcota bacterium]